MKKTLLGFLVAFLALPIASLMPTAAQAATVPTNTAIRGTTVSTVFWYANDGKRYVFPNAATYYTWFPSFDNVRTISDSELYSISIGGNVTYRPGAKLVKVNTDPKVYVVARGAVLRHVTSEYLAERLFGSDWRTDVHDIADVYFTNYTVGSPIYNESDYNVSNEYNGVSTPSDSMRGMTGTGSTGEIVLNASRTNINTGEAVTLSVNNTLNYGSGYRLEIYDTRTNGLVRTCNLPVSYCDITVYPQRNTTENSVQYYAALRDSSSMTIKSGYSPVIYFGGTSQNGTLTLSANNTNIVTGESVALTATYGSDLPSGYSVAILFTGAVVAPFELGRCYTRTCVLTHVPTRSPMSYTAALYNASNNLVSSSQPVTVYQTGSQNGTLTLSSSRTTLNSGETVVLNAWTSNTFNNSRIEIRDGRDNTLVSTCYTLSNCSYTATVYGRSNGETFRYVAELKDWNGTTVQTAYSPTILVNGTSQNGTLTITANRTSINLGETIVLQVNNPGSASSYIDIYDVRDNSWVHRCNGQFSTCEKVVSPSANSSQQLRYRAERKNSDGGIVETALSPVINFNYNPVTVLSLSSNKSTFNAGETITITATYSGTLPTNSAIEIFWSQGTTHSATGGSKSCYTTTCSMSFVPVNTNAIYLNARLSGTNDVKTMMIWYSNTGSSNDGVNYINGLVLNADRTNINPGNVVRLNANAFNAGTWSYTGNRITITDMRTNTVVKTCYDSATCLVDVYPQAYSSTNLTAQYQAKIYDRNGVLAMSQYSPVIYLSSYNGGSSYNDYYGYNITQTTGRGLVTFAPTENLRTNAVIYITATFTDTNIPVEDSVVRIYTERSVSPIATCTGSRLCSVSFATGADPINTRVYARLTSRTLSYTTLESPRVNLVTTR